MRTDLLAATDTVTPFPQPRGCPALHPQGRGQERRGRGAALRRLPDPGATRPHPAGVGCDGRLVRGGRGGLHPPARSVHPASPSWPARAGCGSSLTGWSWPSRPTPGCCWRPGSRRAGISPRPTCAWACWCRLARPPTALQGPGPVLVGPGRRPPGGGSCLVVSDTVAGEPEDRRAGRLLQRAGRPVHRRPAPAAARHQVQQVKGRRDDQSDAGGADRRTSACGSCPAPGPTSGARRRVDAGRRPSTVAWRNGSRPGPAATRRRRRSSRPSGTGAVSSTTSRSSRTPVFLVGMLPHAMTAYLGQGANSALVDALVLSRLLAQEPQGNGDLEAVGRRCCG
jgi:hypothetical protein